jgi:hypothetical protein
MERKIDATPLRDRLEDREITIAGKDGQSYLGVKDKILTVDLPHELHAKFYSLFELLFGLARGDRSSVPQASDARDAAINSRE